METAVVTPVKGAGVSSGLRKRVVSAVVLVPIMVWIVTGAPAWLFATIVVVVSGAAAWEFGRLFARMGHVIQPALIVLCTAAVTASFLAPGAPMAALAGATVLILGSSLVARRPVSSEGTTVGLTCLCYAGVLLGHVLLLHQLPEGRALILFLLAVTWVGDSAAYVVGSTVGRHQLAPTISPGKTVEGAIGQLLASLGAALGLGWLVPGWSPIESAGAGLLLGVVGQIGDLAESQIKRSVGAKDAGALIPGHGGLLDRIDGLLFNAPALFYYWVGVLGGRV
jgi:phosphatidate cytidylyltransferase